MILRADQDLPQLGALPGDHLALSSRGHVLVVRGTSILRAFGPDAYVHALGLMRGPCVALVSERPVRSPLVEAVSQPIEAISDDVALGRLLAEVGCRFPATG